MSLDKVTNVAVLLVCCAVIGDIAYSRLSRRPNPPTAAQPERPSASYQAGETFPSIPGLKQEPNKSALLLVVRSNCIYCKKSEPFYKKLVEQVRADRVPTQIFGVCLESTTACAEYFKNSGVEVDMTVGVPGGIPKVSGTPTLLLLDEKSTVKSVWVGALPPEGEKRVMSAVLSASSRASF